LRLVSAAVALLISMAVSSSPAQAGLPARQTLIALILFATRNRACLFRQTACLAFTSAKYMLSQPAKSKI
jgi:hypothetical protein